jgi:hypothetical protein
MIPKKITPRSAVNLPASTLPGHRGVRFPPVTAHDPRPVHGRRARIVEVSEKPGLSSLAEALQLGSAMKNLARLAVATSMVAFLAGCPKQKDEGPMTQAEAKAALEESTVDSQAAALTTSSVELGTNFTSEASLTRCHHVLRTHHGHAVVPGCPGGEPANTAG